MIYIYICCVYIYLLGGTTCLCKLVPGVSLAFPYVVFIAVMHLSSYWGTLSLLMIPWFCVSVFWDLSGMLIVIGGRRVWYAGLWRPNGLANVRHFGSKAQNLILMVRGYT